MKKHDLSSLIPGLLVQRDNYSCAGKHKVSLLNFTPIIASALVSIIFSKMGNYIYFK